MLSWKHEGTRVRIWIFFLGFLFASSLSEAALSDLKLDVKYHRQEHELSCEAAALKMVLNYYGLTVTEAEILQRMPMDRRPKKDGIWGDPDLAFVGDVDGVMGVSGYGIHWPAMARLASEWKRTEILESGKVTDLTRHLQERRPVLVWGYHRSSAPLEWRTPAGRTVRGLKGQHVRVVYGFRGNAEAPEGFFVMDPFTGPRYWKLGEFLKNWDSFGRKGIVLYAERNP